MSLTVGQPVWTSGHFNRVAAQDDLGIEALGAGMLRELIPGVVETSISAGYYSYYPFLLDEFERRNPDALERLDFRRFYRRQEAAFAAACVNHNHRGDLRGINGSNRAFEVAHHKTVDVETLAAETNGYMKSSLGGYGLFYRPALEDIGLTRLGAGNRIVDRATDLGRQAADGFRSALQETEYWNRWFYAPTVPNEVLAELGEIVCPCQMPGRADQAAVIDTLFRHTGDSEKWQQLHQYRTQSFGLLLEFHTDRPDDHGGIGGWRRSLISGQLGTKPWNTSFHQHREAWRAYQYRETLVIALTTLFSSSLTVLNRLGSASPGQIAEEIVESIEWSKLSVAPTDPFGRLVESSEALRQTPDELVATAETAFQQFGSASVNQALTTAARLVAALAVLPDGDELFNQLLDRGGSERLSVTHISHWLDERRSQPCAEVLRELIVFLFHRHLRVATTKLSPTDKRDPYCVAAQEDGTYKVIRDDEPFWTGARFEMLNHLLWTAGALNEPGRHARPTELGRTLLAEVRADG